THAALGFGTQFLELALATATGVDLRLHDIERARQLLGSSFGLICRGDSDAFSDRCAVGLEDLFGLIFVNVHIGSAPVERFGETLVALIGTRMGARQPSVSFSAPAISAFD